MRRMHLGLAHWPGKPIEPKDTEFPISSIIKCDPQALSDQQGRNSMTVVSHRELSISSPMLQYSDVLKIGILGWEFRGRHFSTGSGRCLSSW